MHSVQLLAVGSPKTSWIREGCQQYLSRVSLEVLEVPASKQKDPTKQLQEESEALLKKLEKIDGEAWVLDERGDAFTSKGFAEALSEKKDQGIRTTYVLGGAFGLTDAVRQRADRIISLSTMTFPHEMCRLIFLEQLYRAIQINKGTGYHH